MKMRRDWSHSGWQSKLKQTFPFEWMRNGNDDKKKVKQEIITGKAGHVINLFSQRYGNNGIYRLPCILLTVYFNPA
jgi:hypothetical protein